MKNDKRINTNCHPEPYPEFIPGLFQDLMEDKP
jgi:hypothetical protein